MYFLWKNESKKRTCHVEDTAPIICFMDFSQFAVAENRAKSGVLVKKLQIVGAIVVGGAINILPQISISGHYLVPKKRKNSPISNQKNLSETKNIPNF